MKILMIAENWPPRVGGIENYLSHIAQWLPDKSVTVVAPNGSDTDKADFGRGIKNVETHRFFWPFVLPKWLPLFINLSRRAKKGEFDIVLCGKALFEGLIGYYLKRHFGIPYIVFTYAMEIETWSSVSRNRRKLKRALINADRVVYINDVTKKKLMELGVKESQLVKIWPGVDERFFKEISFGESDAVLHKYKLEKPYIITVARLVSRKGIDTVIEAFAQLDQTKFDNTSLVIVGNGPELKNLKEAAKNNFIERSVRFFSNVPDEHLPALYHNAEFFVLTPKQTPTDMEGFGIVYQEAAACGLPAIASSTGGAKEAVINSETGIIVAPEDASTLSKAIALLLSNKEEKNRLGSNACARAQKEFQWHKRILLVKGMIDAVLQVKIQS